MTLDEPLILDVVAAVVIAAIVLVVSPGTAVDAILVLVLLVIWGVGALVSRRRARGDGGGGLGGRLRRGSGDRASSAARSAGAQPTPAERSAQRTGAWRPQPPDRRR